MRMSINKKWLFKQMIQQKVKGKGSINLLSAGIENGKRPGALTRFSQY